MAKFMAIYTGQPGAGARTDEATVAKGMQAWTEWMTRHADHIVEGGGPLGKTKTISSAGIKDSHNNIAAFVIVEADDHEAAARMFEGHPHFSIFPGDGVEVMPILPIPTRS
jgi:phosphoketolase